jgi:hypothetical protein
VIIILKDLEFVEETDEYLKFKVNDLSITKLITFLVEYGEREDFHLSELELLLFSLNLLRSETQSKIRQLIDLINDCLENQHYLSFEWDFHHFYNKLAEILNMIDANKIINGEFTAYKGSLKIDFQIHLI